jgi:SAM-dependent methyltransferase
MSTAMSDPIFKDYFSTTATGYAAHRPRYPLAVADYLASIAPSHQVAIDMACGTGQLSVLLATHFERVIATDASSAQIANAEPRANIDYQVASADSSGLADQSVDLITVAQAAHWLPLELVYQEVRRIAKPNAIFALISYGMTQVKDPVIDQLIQHFYHNVVGQYWPPERQHIVEGYRHLSFPFEEISTPRFEMQATWRCEQLIGYLNTWSAVTQAKKDGQTAAIDQFYAQLAQAWGGDHPQHIFWDVVIRATRLG